MQIPEVQKIVTDYLAVFPEETEKLQPLTERLLIDEKFNHRKSFSGHGTGAAIVLSPNLGKVLLVHHILLDKWLQPGGHWDPEDPDPWTVAAREAVEETGIEIARHIPLLADHPEVPIDIDCHRIPPNDKKQEPAHLHHDFRYVFVAKDEALVHQEDEVSEAVWIDIHSSDERLGEVAGVIAKLTSQNLI